jgi:micrococcal nuclease
MRGPCRSERVQERGRQDHGGGGGGAAWTRRRLLASCSALGAIAAGCAPVPDLQPLVRGETDRAVDASDGDLLILASGLRVRLAEIEAPALGRRGRRDDPGARGARSLLAAACVGRTVELWYGGLSRDRYDRAIAHVMAREESGGALWLNGMMVRQGAARVRSWADNAARVRALYLLEEEARKAVRGLWAIERYGLQAASAARIDGFAIVAGPFVRSSTGPEALAQFSAAGVRLILPDAYPDPPPEVRLVPGKPVRLRGRVLALEEGGLGMRLTHWGQVEAPLAEG